MSKCHCVMTFYQVPVTPCSITPLNSMDTEQSIPYTYSQHLPLNNAYLTHTQRLHLNNAYPRGHPTWLNLISLLCAAEKVSYLSRACAMHSTRPSIDSRATTTSAKHDVDEHHILKLQADSLRKDESHQWMIQRQ